MTATFYSYAHFKELIEKRGEPYTQPRISTIEKHLGKSLQHGDVVNFDDDRALHSFIVVEKDGNKHFLKNPDNAGAGYISIPLDVTETLRNAVKYYSNVIKSADYLLSDIQLSAKDTTVKTIFLSPSDILARAEFFYYPSSYKLGVEIDGVQKHFPLSVQQNDIERKFTAHNPPLPIMAKEMPNKKRKSFLQKVKKALLPKTKKSSPKP